MSFSNKNMKDLCNMFELNHPIKTQHDSKAETPHIMIISILKKRRCFLIHLLSRLVFFTTIALFVQCFAQHFAKVQQNLHTKGLITTIIKNSSKIFYNIN